MNAQLISINVRKFDEELIYTQGIKNTLHFTAEEIVLIPERDSFIYCYKISILNWYKLSPLVKI